MAARFDERELEVAGVYARALLELVGSGEEADATLAELAEVASALDAEPDFERFIASPLVDPEARDATLEKALRGRVSDRVVDTLLVMNRKGRLGLLRAMVEAYRLQHEELRGEVDVEVATAVELSAEQRRQIAAAATEFAGRTARLVERVDPDLLGGLVLQVGDRKVDGSVARQIRELGRRLRDRASSEIHEGKEYFAETG